MTEARAQKLKRRLHAIDQREVISGPQVADLPEILAIQAELKQAFTAMKFADSKGEKQDVTSKN